ncbi:M48 family metallopeptidase [Roseateles sp. UC29_93]|uniref:M48 family metallopeptidase n=1 Tax=Roseateles sp. UC29_93 TaxID=3350177 RepID=UPI003670A60F
MSDIDGTTPAVRGAETGIAPVWLALIALAASFFHQLMLLVPAALVTLAPAAVFDNWLFWGAGVLAFVLMAWLAQPSWHGSPHRLTREQAPRLYARVDEMTDAIGAPRLHAIAIDNSINAGALEEHRGVSLRPTRRVLILGLPLLRLLDTAAAEAVIAHELGHFSRRHGRLGHWLYRTRAAWTAWAASVREDEDDSSPWDRAGANFAELFLPWFSRASEAHSRRCEFEADALAAQWASPEALARALLLIEIAVMRQGEAPTSLDVDALRASAEPPAQWADQAAQELLAHPPTPEEIAEALRHRQPQGSHPPHRQRMEALGVVGESIELRPPAWEESAAAQWLDGVWPELCQARGPWAGVGERLSWAMAHEALVGLDAGQPARAAATAGVAGAVGRRSLASSPSPAGRGPGGDRARTGSALRSRAVADRGAPSGGVGQPGHRAGVALRRAGRAADRGRRVARRSRADDRDEAHSRAGRDDLGIDDGIRAARRTRLDAALQLHDRGTAA